MNNVAGKQGGQCSRRRCSCRDRQRETKRHENQARVVLFVSAVGGVVDWVCWQDASGLEGAPKTEDGRPLNLGCGGAASSERRAVRWNEDLSERYASSRKAVLRAKYLEGPPKVTN